MMIYQHSSTRYMMLHVSAYISIILLAYRSSVVTSIVPSALSEYIAWLVDSLS